MKRLKLKDDSFVIRPPHPEKYSVLRDELNHFAVSEVYPKLVKKLQTDLTSVGESVLRKLIAETPEDLRLAGFIYAVATEDYERVKDEYERLMGKWVTDAREKIAQLKREKRWEGGVYTADVERYVAQNVEEHSAAREVVRQSGQLRDAARRLFEAYESRLSSLQSYGKLVQKRKGLTVKQKHLGNWSTEGI